MDYSNTPQGFIRWLAEQEGYPVENLRKLYDKFSAYMANLPAQTTVSSAVDLLAVLTRPKSEGKPKSREFFSGADAIRHWNSTYISSDLPHRKLAKDERILLARLADTYGNSPQVKSLISYYITNYRSLTYVQGFPTVKALWGFKDRILADMTLGPTAKAGQFDAHKEVEDAFG